MTPEQSAAVANIREAIDNQPAHRAQRDDPVPVKTDDLRTLLSALDAAQAAEQAIDDELVTIGATLSTYPTPRDAVRALIDWHVAVALDPSVSSDARALIDRGAAAQAPREAPRLTPQDIDELVLRVTYEGDETTPWRAEWTQETGTPLIRAVESRVRELCGVAP